ncbi:CpsD/CapB family tyrosine-protein kinase [Gorillibacterium massiliense]|uniref:CpsD/CapB family tyrosine-protein kinase n=1 Tax=Gorillibacterium massiliense TaxID=1280390 RepID=UPI0004AFE0A0|nr:CpsD/CapB family tyrosine-protein kinase [Gorillibacterium massiliense]
MQQQTDKSLILMDTNPESPYSEAYRKLRTNIEFSSVGKDVKVLMFTSSQKGEGKTHTAVNLAVSLAQAGKRTILVDADLRAPSVHRYFAPNNLSGLANYLAMQIPLEQIIMDTHIPGLALIPAGATPPNSAELLTMRRMDALLDILKEKYDMVIIDTPPILKVADAQIVAARADGVLLVVEYGKIKQEWAKKVKTSLAQVNANLLGIVINKANRSDFDATAYYGAAR